MSPPENEGAVNRLAYIFWAAALFLLGGCTATPKPQQVLLYRMEICRQETATASPAGMVFDPPPLAMYSGDGQSEVAGISLNNRPSTSATNGWYDLTAGQYYQLRYYDRHPDQSVADGYLDRTFQYYKEGVKVR